MLVVNWLSSDQIMYQILDKKNEKCQAEFTGSILNAGLSSDPLEELTALS